MSNEDMEVRMRNVEKTLERIETKLDIALKDSDDHEVRLRAVESKPDTATADIADHEKRLRCLEGKGGKRWDTLVAQIIGLIAAGAVGWLLGQI